MEHVLDIQTVQLSSVKNRAFNQQYFYPFDRYRAVTNFFAINSNNNTSLPISHLVFTDFANNFDPKTVEHPSRTVFNGSFVDSFTSVLSLERTANAQLYTVMLFLLNWALTGMTVYITMLIQIGEALGEGIVVLPLTILLILPMIRGMFVESPPFGEFLLTYLIYSYVGLIIYWSLNKKVYYLVCVF